MKEIKSRRRGLRAAALSGVLAISFGLLGPASAQENGGEEAEAAGIPAFLPPMQLQRFRPAPGPADYITVFGSSVAPHMQWNVGSFMSYADDPLRLGTLETPEARTVAYQAQIDLMATLGILDVLEVGLSVPWTVRQRGENLAPLLPPGADRDELGRAGLNDWRLTTKYQLLPLSENPFGVAMVAGLNLPVGARDRLMSDERLGAEALLVGEYVFLETLRTSANLGFRYRHGQRILRQNVIGNEITWGLAAHAPFLTENLDVLAEVAGALGVERKPSYLQGIGPGEVPVELKGALRYRVAENFHFQDWVVTGGFGVGLTDGVGTPDWRFFLGITGQWVTGGWWNVDYRQPRFEAQIDPCSIDVDDRGRRLRLGLDRPDCPEPEVVRMTEEERIALLERVPAPPMRQLSREAPPAAAEPVAEPDSRGSAILRQGVIIITEEVRFNVGSAVIVPESYGVLNDVATLLHDYPEIELIRVEGHTDSIGNRDNNLRLSEERARSVKDFLIGEGIDASRVTSVGYGQERPMADNDTPEGRAANRRVEFNILEMSDGEAW